MKVVSPATLIATLSAALLASGLGLANEEPAPAAESPAAAESAANPDTVEPASSEATADAEVGASDSPAEVPAQPPQE